MSDVIERIYVHGAPAWLLPDGRVMYPIAGGAEGDPDEAAGAGDDSPDDGGDDDEEPVARLRRQARHHESENRRLKAELEKARKAEERLQEIENAQKSEAERAAEEREAAKREAAEARLELARTRVALRKGLTESQARRLQGTTEEELEADADELLKDLRPVDDDEGDDLPRRPRERLRSPSRPERDVEETDPRKLAASLPRY